MHFRILEKSNLKLPRATLVRAPEVDHVLVDHFRREKSLKFKFINAEHRLMADACV